MDKNYWWIALGQIYCLYRIIKESNNSEHEDKNSFYFKILLLDFCAEQCRYVLEVEYILTYNDSNFDTTDAPLLHSAHLWWSVALSSALSPWGKKEITRSKIWAVRRVLQNFIKFETAQCILFLSTCVWVSITMVFSRTNSLQSCMNFFWTEVPLFFICTSIGFAIFLTAMHMSYASNFHR